MSFKINYKISSQYNGITFEDISIETVLRLTEIVVGLKGPYKCTISWDNSGTGDTEPDTEPEIKPPEVDISPTAEETIPVPTSIPVQELEDETPKQEHEPKFLTVGSTKLTPGPENVSEPDEDLDKHDDANLLPTLDQKIKKNDFTTSKYVSIGANLHYGETEDGRLLIRYFATRVDTTWDDMIKLEQTVLNPLIRGIPLLAHSDTGNRRSAVIKFIEQMRIRRMKPGQAIELLKGIDHPAEKTKTEPVTVIKKDTVVFYELDRISSKDLTKLIDINLFDMGYYDQGDGKIVICYGSSKVYTSWEDMFKLPTYIDLESIVQLNNLKQVAVRQFRKWMTNNPSLLPEGVDPDAEFRSAGVGSSVYPPASPGGQDFGGENSGDGF